MKLFSAVSVGIGFLTLDLLPAVSANFHVGRLYNGNLRYVACPSNYYNCQCFAFGDRTGRVTLPPGNAFLQTFFQIDGLCGASKLDFYKRGDGHWDIYKNGGTGAIEGTCYSNSDEKSCVPDRVGYADELVCYSYICGS